MPTIESPSPSAQAISVAEGRKETIRMAKNIDPIGRIGPIFCSFFATIYGSPSPFLPFFFAGSTSRGRVVGGGGASTFGVVTSGFGCGLAASASALGGGGRVPCSRFGSVAPAGRDFCSAELGAATCGVVTAGGGWGLAESASALGGGGSVTCSSFGSVDPAGRACGAS